MPNCPHCETEIARSELLSGRLLSPRVCRACGGGYTDGGTTTAFALIAAVGTIITHANRQAEIGSGELVAAFVACAVILWFTRTHFAPIDFSEFRFKLLQLLFVVPLVSLMVSAVISVIT